MKLVLLFFLRSIFLLSFLVARIIPEVNPFFTFILQIDPAMAFTFHMILSSELITPRCTTEQTFVELGDDGVQEGEERRDVD